MNKGIIIATIVAIVAIGFSAAVLSQTDSENTDIEEIESTEPREPKHYTATLEDGMGVSHGP